MSEPLNIDIAEREFAITNYSRLSTEVRRLREQLAEKDRQHKLWIEATEETLGHYNVHVKSAMEDIEDYYTKLAAANGGRDEEV